MSDIAEERKKKLLLLAKQNNNYIIYVLLAVVIWFGYSIRTKNLGNLIDQTTGQYIPMALDPFIILRYAEQVLEHGSLMAVDTLRYFPIGYANPSVEFGFLSSFIVYLYKFLHFFDPSMTLQYVHVLYPAIAFIFIGIFFFLFVKELFDGKIALLATAFLAVLPPFLYRSMAGFADKEALATVFMFAAFYFFVKAWKTEDLKQGIMFALLAGVATALAGKVWGGFTLILMTIGLFALVELVLNKFTTNRFYYYSTWLVSLVFILHFFTRFTFTGLIFSITAAPMFLAFGSFVIKFLITKYDPANLKEKVSEKIPLGLFSAFLTSLIGLVLVSILGGITYVTSRVSNLVSELAAPLGQTRWALTVAESHQPYVAGWISQFSMVYFLIFFIAAFVLFYFAVEGVKKYKWWLTSVYVVLISSFVFSRYSPGAKSLNGSSDLAIFMFLGSMFLFVVLSLIFVWYTYLKDKDVFSQLRKIPATFIFVLAMYLMFLFAARTAVRLLYIFAPMTAILAAYLIFICYKYIGKIDLKYLKIACYVILFLIVLSPFGNITSSAPLVKHIPTINDDGLLVQFAKSSSNSAQSLGPSYHAQWQNAMKWVRENTPEDSVFSHWWDYGYWVQYGGRRATLSDGGNARGAINHFTGRYLLTNPDRESALEFLYANKATHVLMIGDEIGKYSAYSSIGSDENYDRYSWINTFTLDQSKIQEKREDMVLFYSGNFVLDGDVTISGKLFPRRGAGIIGFMLPFNKADLTAGNFSSLKQPIAVLAANNQATQVTLSCASIGGKKYEFEGAQLDGCLVVIPYIENNQQGNALGNALYLSGKVKDGQFARLYLFGEQDENFKLVYSDAGSGVPLASYRGRLMGPLKIWSVNYPNDIKDVPMYRETSLPDTRVNEIKREFQ